MNDQDLIAKNKLQTNGTFLFKSEEIKLDNITPADGQILKRQSGKWVNVADPALDPYTTFTFNEGILTPAGAIRTYKGSTLVETLNLDSYYVSATELTTILSGYLTNISSKTVWKIHLNSGGVTGDVATRIAGLTEITDYPEDWVLSVGSTATSLVVTHNLGRELSTIAVWSKDQSTGKRQEMKGDLGYVALYSASDLDSFEIDSLAGTPRELYIYPIFY